MTKEKTEISKEQALCYMCIALKICGIKFTERTVYLVMRLYDKMTEMGGNIDLKTISKIQDEMEEKYKQIPKP